MTKPVKHIFVTGGVTSSLGKGIFAASLAKLLQRHNYNVTIQKFDPYLNVDPGTMNPYEHGECYVTEDGAETDLDLGHYERFLNITTSQENNVTTGRIYQTILDREREGAFLGKTVQVVPHVTDEIKRRMKLLGEKGEYDIILTEIGGTVGDIESLPYVEAVRQLKYELGATNSIVCHLTLVPYLKAAKELKTKPTQHSVKEMLKNGVQPDVLVCRTEHELTAEIRNKLALFCNVDLESVIQATDVETIYDVPLEMLRENLDKTVLKKLNLPAKQHIDLPEWANFLHRLKNPAHEVNIALVGKYVELQDAYKSIHEAFTHAGVENLAKVRVHIVHSEDVDEANIVEALGDMDGVLVAPGFGNRGVAGKIAAIRFARESKIPFLGICLGMQCAVIEFARNVLGIKDANSSEMDESCANAVIDLMEEQKRIAQKGGTMRLGSYDCDLETHSNAAIAYGEIHIKERHRHRYEYNNAFRSQLEEAGLKSTGINPQTGLVEVVEIEDHPWFVGVQFHPELKSTIAEPHPLFVGLVKAAIEYRQEKNQERKISDKTKVN